MKNKILAIIPAAGVGERFLSKKPKQYHKIDQSTLIEKTISIFTSSELISNIIIPIHRDDENIQNQDDEALQQMFEQAKTARDTFTQ